MKGTLPWVIAGLAAAISVAVAAAERDAPFVDAAAGSGLEFRHFNGMTGQLWFVEMMGSGAALFDYDNDGDLDAWLVQGNPLAPEKEGGRPLFPPPSPPPLSDRLFRNDSSLSKRGERAIRFTDVTAESGIEATGYGMGVATGDVDNDGFVDVFVANFGPNQLFMNNGDGSFRDATAGSDIAGDEWSVSASFVDYDRDGLADLYVGNYVDFTLANHKPCRSSTSARDYCSPLVYRPTPDRLYRNLGRGRFEDVTRSAGIAAADGGALGVVAADLDGDGWPDIYVANDGTPNQLWINDGEGGFSDEAVLAGAAVNMDGKPEASMGVDAEDFDDDGDLDLFMTHLTRETNTLYVNDGQGWFEDRTAAQGLAQPSFPFTGFGTAWIDYDNDGLLDILAVNGAVTHIEAQLAADADYPLRQHNQLFRNTGAGRYEDVSAQSGAAFAVEEVGRGAAFGDIDNDGDTDVLVSNNSGPARLLVNQVGSRNAWLGLRLTDPEGRRDTIGATATVSRADGRILLRRAHTDGSYASAGDPRLLFGLGDEKRPQAVRVRWPDGAEELFGPLEPGRYHTLKQGSGNAP